LRVAEFRADAVAFAARALVDVLAAMV